MRTTNPCTPQKSKGFTLVELIISLVIVSFMVLASTVLFATYQQTQARMHLRERTLMEIQNIYAMFEADPIDVEATLARTYGSAFHVEDENVWALRLNRNGIPQSGGQHLILMTRTVDGTLYTLELSLSESTVFDTRLLRRSYRVMP